eukprot:CAMPEP_0204624892 /NCGR_PEP_ID=MMETSP0717-20131115/10657_1 /ASSEMBLY_ACC=CAM_ASM_000666 /TAXON_ID=230516 /ORGANISM="Chaetoceros curvisetus" /LENGTH=63 /DNA_ID=CAMNT_0051640439 /DNA_START=505 /DNA_END=696 /DNA_ORIENTATION=+
MLSVYAPIRSKINQSPTFNSGNMQSFDTMSNSSPDGPWIVLGISSAGLPSDLESDLKSSSSWK